MFRTNNSEQFPLAAGAGYCAPYLYMLKEDSADLPPLSTHYTNKKLRQVTRAIHSGYGLGRGETYTPWLRITRRFSSPVSNMVYAPVSVHGRNHHFLSKLEHHTALQLAYLGSTELRECLPMWPTPHPNPFDKQHKEDVPGLLEIADAAGIEHGVFVGSDVPYIGTIDIMVTVPWAGAIHQVGVSCKPTEILQRSTRAQERVRLDQLYCHAIGARHVREGGDDFNEKLIQQLQEYRPLFSEVIAYRNTAKLADFCGLFDEVAYSLPIHVAINQTAAKLKIPHQDASLLWRLGIWLHLIDIDLRKPVSMCSPIRRGTEHVLKQLAQQYLGDDL